MSRHFSLNLGQNAPSEAKNIDLRGGVAPSATRFPYEFPSTSTGIWEKILEPRSFYGRGRSQFGNRNGGANCERPPFVIHRSRHTLAFCFVINMGREICPIYSRKEGGDSMSDEERESQEPSQAAECSGPLRLLPHLRTEFTSA